MLVAGCEEWVHKVRLESRAVTKRVLTQAQLGQEIVCQILQIGWKAYPRYWSQQRCRSLPNFLGSMSLHDRSRGRLQ